MGLIKFFSVFSAIIFLGVTQVYYLNKDKKKFYEREGLKGPKEKLGKYVNYRGSQFTWSKSLDPYWGLSPAPYIKKTLLVLVVLAIVVQFIPS